MSTWSFGDFGKIIPLAASVNTLQGKCKVKKNRPPSTPPCHLVVPKVFWYILVAQSIYCTSLLRAKISLNLHKNWNPLPYFHDRYF